MADRRTGFQQLYEISKLLTRFESETATVAAVAELLAQALPLRSIVVMLAEKGSAPLQIVPWHAGSAGDARLGAAKAHAEAAYDYLAGSQGSGAGHPAANAPDSDGFIALPLVVGGSAIFGIVQLDSAGRLEESDLLFANVAVDQLAVALDRAAAIEEKQAAAAIAARADERRQIAEATRQRYDEFLAMLAHELRNPLAPIRLVAETMRAIGSADSTIAFGVAVIDRQVTHLSRLVDDLLEVARISRGDISLQKARLELGEVIKAAVESTRPLIEERQHRLAVQPLPAPVYLEVDAIRLTQVVANLLNNAAKFTAKGGEITLSVHAEEKDAVVKVRDSGSGIPADVLPHVFDMFFRADTSLARAYGGMGIGLALARRLVELHGGSIEAKSEGEGKGSEFVVRLPRHDEVPARPPPPEASGTEQGTTASYRVLVVDDNVDAAKATQMLLKMQGHEARCAFDGVSALSLAQEFKPQLVLLDIGMPGMDGYEVARRLRQQAGRAQPVVAALSGYGTDLDPERMKQRGLDHYIVKPVAGQALLKFIAALGERLD